MELSRVVALTIAALFPIGAAAQARPKEVASQRSPAASSPAFGEWLVIETIDKLDDRRKCTLSYKKDPNIFVSPSGNVIRISYAGRGGVSSYRYRLGKQPATELKIASEIEAQTGVIAIQIFDDILGDADRIIVSGLTLTRTNIDEDISLVGMREARAAMRARCDAPN